MAIRNVNPEHSKKWAKSLTEVEAPLNKGEPNWTEDQRTPAVTGEIAATFVRGTEVECVLGV